MGYKHRGKNTHQWRKWRVKNAALIEACQLPEDVVTNDRAWSYFLQHGYNQKGWWNQAPWLEARDIVEDERRESFQRLVESYAETFISPVERESWFQSVDRQYGIRN